VVGTELGRVDFQRRITAEIGDGIDERGQPTTGQPGEKCYSGDLRTAALMQADPGLDPDQLLPGWPHDLSGALLLQ
jgi:hypothetical protein